MAPKRPAQGGNSPPAPYKRRLATAGRAGEEDPEEEVLVANSQSEDEDIEPSLASTHRSESIELRTPLVELLGYGFHVLIDAVYDFELKRDHPPVQRYGKAGCRKHGVAFLASIPDKVLLGLLKGTLARDWWEEDDELVELYGQRPADADDSDDDSAEGPIWQHNATSVAPGHYVRYLVNKEHLPPTPNELLRAIDVMRKYIDPELKHTELASKVDHVRGLIATFNEQQMDDGKYYFLCPVKKGAARARNHDRVRHIETCCDAIELCLNKIPDSLRDEPDVRPLTYVGYAVAILARTNQHEESDLTSYIMALFQHVFRYLKLDYIWESFAVSFAVNKEEFELGEVLVNGLVQSYFDSGFGVAPRKAGMNCSSANLKPGTDVWTKAQAFRHRATPYLVNMRALQSKLQSAAQLKASLEESRRQERQVLVDELKRLVVDPAVLEQFCERTSLPKSTVLDIPASIQAQFQALHTKLDTTKAEWEPKLQAIYTALQRWTIEDDQTS